MINSTADTPCQEGIMTSSLSIPMGTSITYDGPTGAVRNEKTVTYTPTSSAGKKKTMDSSHVKTTEPTYTVTPTDTPTGSGSSTAAIVGGVLGSLIFIILAALLALQAIRFSRKKKFHHHSFNGEVLILIKGNKSYVCTIFYRSSSSE